MPARYTDVSRTVITALAGLFACACTDATFAPASAMFTVTAAADSILSDGVSSTVVSVQLPPSLRQDANVEFTTTLGRWANPGGNPDRKVTVQARGGAAEARLFAGSEVGTAYITAASAGNSARTSIRLVPALPDVIDLFVDRTTAPANGTTAVNVTAVLRRNKGSVSKGIPVRFEVRDSAQTPLAELGGTVLADSTGTAKFNFTSTIPGTVQIRAYAGAAVSDPRTVRLTP